MDKMCSWHSSVRSNKTWSSDQVVSSSMRYQWATFESCAYFVGFGVSSVHSTDQWRKILMAKPISHNEIIWPGVRLTLAILSYSYEKSQWGFERVVKWSSVQSYRFAGKSTNFQKWTQVSLICWHLIHSTLKQFIGYFIEIHSLLVT